MDSGSRIAAPGLRAALERELIATSPKSSRVTPYSYMYREAHPV